MKKDAFPPKAWTGYFEQGRSEIEASILPCSHLFDQMLLNPEARLELHETLDVNMQMLAYFRWGLPKDRTVAVLRNFDAKVP